MEIPKILLQKADEITAKLQEKYPEAAPFFKGCFLNTIETTVTKLDDGGYFVITGDIPAMWLRDSAAQLTHYIRYANEDEDLKEIIRSVIERQAQFVCIDPYANAFNAAPNSHSHNDETDFAISYDAYFSKVLYEAKGRRSKKREKQLLDELQSVVDQLAEEAGGQVFWDKPLREARLG